MINNPYQAYNQTSVMTASPAELTLMLYNGAIRFLKQGISAMEQKNTEEAHKNLSRVQNILIEFMSTLKMEYQVSGNLMSLYDFMRRHLVEANIKKDAGKAREVLELLEDLRNTWSEAMKLARVPHPTTGSGY